MKNIQKQCIFNIKKPYVKNIGLIRKICWRRERFELPEDANPQRFSRPPIHKKNNLLFFLSDTPFLNFFKNGDRYV